MGLNRGGVPRADEGGKLVRRNIGPVSLVVVPALREGLRPVTRLWDVEGESDLLAALDAGVQHVVTSTGGASSLKGHERHRAFLLSLHPTEVVVVRDRDDTGRRGAEKAAEWWLGAGVPVRRVDLPEKLGEGGDLRDFLLGRPARHGRPAVEPLGDRAALEALADAEPRIPSSGGNADWSAELPSLPELEAAAPNLPAEYLPESLRPWVEDVAERVSVPLEFVAAPMIVSASALVGRSLGIRPKRADDWTAVPNLWGCVVGPPGVLKTAATQEGTHPIRRLATEASREFETEKSAAETKLQIANLRRESVRQEGKRLLKKHPERIGEIEKQLQEIQAEIENATPTERRYFTSDATVEKIGALLVENPRGLLVLRDELSGLLRTLDKPGREGDREFYLESWNGAGGYSVDRIARGTLHIPAVTLSIFGGAQPAKLRSYIDATLTHEAGHDGLLQRFQLLVWPDDHGEWRNVDRPPNAEARERAYRIFATLDTLDPAKLGDAVECSDEGEIPALRFCDDAQELFDTWRDELERKVRSPEAADRPAFTSHVAKYRSLMPSLSLLFHLVEWAGTGGARLAPVSLAAARLAASWVEYLECHARKVYGREIQSGVGAARALARKIQCGAVVDGTPIRDIARRGWSELSRTALVHEGVDALEAVGWVRRERIDSGGRPSELVRLHPALRKGDS